MRYIKMCKNTSGTTPNTQIPALMVNDTIYYFSGKAITSPPEDSVFDEITSIVSLTELPVCNNQANFGELNSPYYVIDSGVVIWFGGKWILFVNSDE